MPLRRPKRRPVPKGSAIQRPQREGISRSSMCKFSQRPFIHRAHPSALMGYSLAPSGNPSGQTTRKWRRAGGKTSNVDPSHNPVGSVSGLALAACYDMEHLASYGQAEVSSSRLPDCAVSDLCFGLLLGFSSPILTPSFVSCPPSHIPCGPRSESCTRRPAPGHMVKSRKIILYVFFFKSTHGHTTNLPTRTR